ncbi:hypothetical protein NXS98_06195 [Fontisphaera persica]|uniref:hypothetical protein n=1 Tax=Fontisphaera persica TaxID=2974023 RepID=UPI0024BFEF1F|nr:hypothetical protein [Fontisphaera persica]WCJ60715.1 hypothetical protein NXS98_06195 [Fontisphaera persica]
MQIPDPVQEDAAAFVSQFSTALILDGNLVGSGTFIKCGNTFGVLTAHHVIHNPHDPSRRFDFNSSQKLGLLVADFAHCYELQLQYCGLVDIATPKRESTGPDLSLIVLPEPLIGTIKAKKQFYNLKHKRAIKLRNALPNAGYFIFSGYPDLQKDLLAPQSGFREVLFLEGWGAASGISRRWRWKNSYDFLELGITYGPKSDAIPTFQGMSGGGVWRVPLSKKTSRSTVTDIVGSEPVLAGVGFYEVGRVERIQEIRCHGPRSIYEKAVERLLRCKHLKSTRG